MFKVAIGLVSGDRVINNGRVRKVETTEQLMVEGVVAKVVVTFEPLTDYNTHAVFTTWAPVELASPNESSKVKKMVGNLKSCVALMTPKWAV